MNIKRLRLTQFTSHDDSTLVLPSAGVLLVTGPNGAGKSSLAEAVAWGLWGKTLRGSTPWRGDAKPPCTVEVDCDDLEVRRARTGAKTDIAFVRGDRRMVDAEEWPTAQKAQEALDATILDFDLWRRSHVFSSADASNFTTATDHERKRLLEGVLGLQRFDAALEACRADLAAAKSEAQSHAHALDLLAAKVSDAQARMKRDDEALATIGTEQSDLAPLTGKSADELRKLVLDCDRDIQDIHAQLRKADAAGADHAATARQIEATLARLRDDACPTCTQAIPASLRKRLEQDAAASRAQVAQARDAAKASLDDVQAALDELQEERAHLDERHQQRKQAEALRQRARDERARSEQTRSTLERARKQAEQDLADARAKQAEHSTALATARAKLVELEASERALGMKGIRAHILGTALAGVEAVANSWLAKLGLASLRLRLNQYTEKKTGGTTAALALEVSGAGGGHGYKGASGGERRRLDVALLLALAEVSGAAHGQRPGTLWFDEVFDALDEEGTEAVAAALTELARDRVVVVVSHSSHFVSRLPGARRINVVAGHIEG
jgi:exonuclease SbcC